MMKALTEVRRGRSARAGPACDPRALPAPRWYGLRVPPQETSDKYDVVLISPRNYFLYTPLLPAVCTGTMEDRSIVEPVRCRADRAPSGCAIRDASAPVHRAACFAVPQEPGAGQGPVLRGALPEHRPRARGARVLLPQGRRPRPSLLQGAPRLTSRAHRTLAVARAPRRPHIPPTVCRSSTTSWWWPWGRSTTPSALRAWRRTATSSRPLTTPSACASACQSCLSALRCPTRPPRSASGCCRW